MNSLIRKGKSEDLKSVYDLIVELAVYEKAGDSVFITAEKLIDDFNSNDKPFDFFVAEKDGHIIGVALYYLRYSTWNGSYLYLEDLIVTEKERGNGAGKELFEELVRLTKKLKLRKMQWQVLDWNEPAINFYKKYKTQFEHEWVDCVIYQDEINSIADDRL